MGEYRNRKGLVNRAISSELDNEIVMMMKKLQKVFGFTPTVKQTTQVLAWKINGYNMPLTRDKLKEILGSGQ